MIFARTSRSGEPGGEVGVAGADVLEPEDEPPARLHRPVEAGAYSVTWGLIAASQRSDRTSGPSVSGPVLREALTKTAVKLLTGRARVTNVVRLSGRHESAGVDPGH